MDHWQYDQFIECAGYSANNYCEHEMVKIKWHSKDGITNKAKQTDINIHFRVGGKVTKKDLSILKWMIIEEWQDQDIWAFDEFERGPKNPVLSLEIKAKGVR